jgi:hypothetical protein
MCNTREHTCISSNIEFIFKDNDQNDVVFPMQPEDMLHTRSEPWARPAAQEKGQNNTGYAFSGGPTKMKYQWVEV